MQLDGKIAVVWGGGGSVGAAAAGAFARDGASVFLAGRSLPSLERTAGEIESAGGAVEVAQVDVLDVAAANAFADDVADRAGRIDVSFDALSNDDEQGTLLLDLEVDQLVRPVEKAMRSRFATTKAVARHMVERRSGVILTVTGGYRESFPSLGGTIIAWAALEALCRQWASELGPHGVRVVWLRTTGIADSIPDTGDALADLGTGFGEGMTREQIIADMRQTTLLDRLPSLADVGNVAAFLASDGAAAMTSTFGNISCGSILD
jgi:NAD(P)-dependent dehydrogenase (short-subunit alcohol dehydrogenase family)